jgi:hypothetical protein
LRWVHNPNPKRSDGLGAKERHNVHHLAKIAEKWPIRQK